MRKDIAAIFFWFCFAVYGLPTVFAAIVMASGIRTYQPNDWLLFAWGGSAMAFALHLKESA